ncbi:hypothetical protein OUZ56_026339 [Daphnia magna]|uniref:Uncharacterized protein n=1 Tax=Daphnia magna TaxID=35525 RepID=A0ABQ9ZLG7_9CRUS|nr:hypothetical protein OUZ56_026339 [Daphnia magna]
MANLHDVLFVPGLGNQSFLDPELPPTLNGTEIMSGQRVGKSLYHLKVIAKQFRPRQHLCSRCQHYSSRSNLASTSSPSQLQDYFEKWQELMLSLDSILT